MTGCHHSWQVWCEQRWRWRVSARCPRCGAERVAPGRWWRRSRADQAMERLLAMVAVASAEPEPAPPAPPSVTVRRPRYRRTPG